MESKESAQDKDEVEASNDSREEDSFDKMTPLKFKEFLEDYSLNTFQRVSDFYFDNGKGTSDYYRYEKSVPQLKLWCADEHCQGYRRFDGKWKSKNELGGDEIFSDFLIYTCRDCGTKQKTYCLRHIAAPKGGGLIIKIGEYPDVHIDLPPYLPTLLGEDYKTFIKGLKAEKQGLGIGSFSYYRRVVENQKSRLINEISKVAKRLGSPSDVLKNLDKAAKETQFSNAVDDVKDLIPASLLIEGHNPLKILHQSLSIGLHESNDEVCLNIAHSIRMVLQELSQRIKEALRDERNLKTALSTVLQFNSDNSRK